MESDEEIPWKLKSHPDMLVVESVITNEQKQHFVHLTLTNSYFDSSIIKPVTGATVEIKEGTNNFTFTESSPGWYFSDQEFAGTPLKTYQLSINLKTEINGLYEYSAISTMPEGITIDSINCEIYKMPEFSGLVDNKDTTLLAIAYFGYEPTSPGNYYLNKVYKNGILLQGTPKEYQIYSDEYANGNYTHLSIYNKNISPGDTIRFRLYSIEKSFYKFIEGIQNIDLSGNAYSMSGPPANAVGNISDGKALGFFTVLYVSEKTSYAIDKR
jgi:hypothetical protein